MSEARYCDRCGGIFAGVPTARIVTPSGEFDLCADCGGEFEEWWELPEQDEAVEARPTSKIERE